MYISKIRPAFTMLELVFVIVILGIVSSVGSTIIAQLFENVINQRAVHKASLKTELAANQIVNRLTYRLPNSLITRGFGAGGGLNAGYRIVSAIGPADSNTAPEALEWIGYDNDSFATAARPGWSGYCDTLATNAGAPGTPKNTIVTRGSNLALTNTVIANLSGGTKTIADSAVVFSTSMYNTAANLTYNAQCLGYTNSNCIHTINAINANSLTKDNNYVIGDTISDHFKLAWTAYALVPTNITANNLFDLNLCYNYQPWDGNTIANARCSLFMRNVTSFKYNEVAGTVRFKICATENIGTDVNVSVCKEKVVIR